MVSAQDKALMGEVSGLIAERMGLHFPEERWPDLARGIMSAGEELGFSCPDACLSWLRTRELTARQIETLASHLTVGETYFLRDPASFDVLEREILPPLIAQRTESGGTLRLWSAGCCTGEEAYSLAITCARALPKLREWKVSILATDINPRALAKAGAGVYSEWSFRGSPDWLRERFFSPAPDKKLALNSTIRNMVQFGYLNLAEDVYPSLHNYTNAMDVIFCRNVLMYFTPAHQRRVAAALHRCLVDGGCLFVNPAEASSSLFPMFFPENIGGVVLYRKTSGAPRVEPWPAPVAPSPFVPVAVSEFVVPPVPPVPTAPAVPAQPVAPVPGVSCVDALTNARACANRGRLEESLALCQAAIEVERTNPDAHFLHATICHELNRFDEAIAALGRVLYLDQDFILAHHALGGLYERLGKTKESRRHLSVALELLSARGRDEIVPGSDGMTCGRLLESVRAMAGA
jgi:chemotaxis protein methyltransferase CheR